VATGEYSGCINLPDRKAFLSPHTKLFQALGIARARDVRLSERLASRVTNPVASGLVAYAFVVVMLGTTLPTPLYPLYQARMGFSALVITVIFATYAVGVIAGLLLFGRLSDQIGRRRVLLPGIALSGASAVVFLLAGGLTMLLVGRLLSGLSAGIFTGTATAALIDLAPEHRRGRAGLIAAAVNMGGLGLGPLLSGVLAQYGPAPLKLCFAVDLALLAPAAIGVLTTPEPAQPTGALRLRPQRLRIPHTMRQTFISAAIAGFAGFAVVGLFTAVSPTFLGQILHKSNHAVSGFTVFSVLAASTVGQVITGYISQRRGLLAGALTLACGAAVIATSLLTESFGLLYLGAIVAGLGQGASFRAGLSAVGAASPPAYRSEVSSSFFVIIYVALSIPVIGVGAGEQSLGIVTAGAIFAAVVTALALVAFVLLKRLSN
jgi:MFS family permease